MSDGKRIGGRQRSLSFKSLNFLLPWETSDRRESQERLRAALFYGICRLEWLSVLSVRIKKCFHITSYRVYLMHYCTLFFLNNCSISQVQIWTSITAILRQLAGGLLLSKQNIFRFFSIEFIIIKNILSNKWKFSGFRLPQGLSPPPKNSHYEAPYNWTPY